MAFRLPTLLVILFSIFCFTSGCSATFNQTSPQAALSGPQLADNIGQSTVALVSDAPGDDDHGTFCSAVWVGHHTILTANHCLEGYAKHLLQAEQVKALLHMGMPLEMALMAVELAEDVDLDDPTVPTEVRAIVMVIRSVPPVNPDTLHIAYIVRDEVVDIGVAPKAIHHAQVVARIIRGDLAILRTYGPTPAHSYAHLAQVSPPVGAQIEVMGTPHHNFWLYRQGVVGAYRHTLKHDGFDKLDGPFMQISLLITHGDSGGGVFDDHGCLVGIDSFMEPGEPALGGYAIPLVTIRGFLAGQHLVPIKLDTNAKDPVLDLDEKLPQSN